jgi:hypothetical protein
MDGTVPVASLRTSGAADTASSGEREPPQRFGELRRFAISRDDCGRWMLEGSAGAPPFFTDLASALAFARRDSDAAAAIIELRVDGVYACVHQPKGWPQRICRAH